MAALFKMNSLNNKILLYIGLVIALYAVVFGFIITLVTQFQMTGKYQVEKEAAIESLSYALSSMLDSHDYRQLAPVISSSLIYENIGYIAVLDISGSIIESASDSNIDIKALQIERHDISSNGKVIGGFDIGFSHGYIDSLMQRTTIIMIVCLVVFLFLAGLALFIFMRRSVIQPLRSFTRIIGRFNPQNLTVRMKASGDDEIGMLARGFNRMAGELQKSHRALEEARDELEQRVEQRTRGERRRADQLRAINEVSRRISAILSLEELLPYITRSLQETFGYFSVNIFIKDEEQGGVVLQAGAGGYAGEAPVGLLARFSDGIIGQVAESGEPVTAGDVTLFPGYRYLPELMATRAELAVPVKLGEETLGVLDVHSTEPGAFDEIDLFSIQTLGAQIAIAIENARLYRETHDLAVLEERNRMAREIHDTLAQGFTGIVLQLEAAEQALTADSSRVQEHIDRARKLARESLNEARRSVWALRPQALEQLPLLPAIRQQIAGFIQDTGIEVVFVSAGDNPELPDNLENAILRILQESLTNIKKHAHASRVEVALKIEEKAVKLTVRDNGTGFDMDVPVTGGFGLKSMSERVRLLGGEIGIKSALGSGTGITVKIPA